MPHPRKAGSKRAKLFVLVDDYSRPLVCGRWMTEENTRAGQEVLRAAIMRRGVPTQLYMDNGSPYRAGQLARTCAVLGIHVIHSKPYSPAGRGKQERLNRYIRERFLTEAEAAGIDNFEDLNDRFSAWASRWPIPGSAQRRSRSRSSGSWPVVRLSDPVPRSWPRRSAGRWFVGSQRPPPCPCSPIATRSIRR